MSCGLIFSIKIKKDGIRAGGQSMVMKILLHCGELILSERRTRAC